MSEAKSDSRKAWWREEIGYSHDVRSEGVEQLREAIKQAKASNPPSSSPVRESNQKPFHFQEGCDAAKELGRIKAEARLDEAKMWRFYTEGKDEPYWCAERILALEAAARKEE